MSLKPLTPREETILGYMMAYMTRYGRHPTVPWLAKKLGLCNTTIPQYFTRLADKGYIFKAPFDSWVIVLYDTDGSPVKQISTIRFEPRKEPQKAKDPLIYPYD